LCSVVSENCVFISQFWCLFSIRNHEMAKSRPPCPWSSTSMRTRWRRCTQVDEAARITTHWCMVDVGIVILAAVFLRHPINLKPPAIMPRGLINMQNMSYVNAVCLYSESTPLSAAARLIICYTCLYWPSFRLCKRC
jgi:hypothetical protein